MSPKKTKPKPVARATTKGRPRPTAVDYDQFVKLWRTMPTVSALAKKLGIKASSASAIANRLRGKGVQLRRFARRPTQAVDAKKLNRIAKR